MNKNIRRNVSPYIALLFIMIVVYFVVGGIGVSTKNLTYSEFQKYLKDDIKYYEDDVITNNDKYFMISELVREKILNLTNEEVPHSVTCVLTNYNEKTDSVYINVDIIVSRDSLKKIIIGKQGSMLKTIGSEARADIERMLGKSVYLELFVKTVKNWRNKEKYLVELGFDEL